MWITSDVSIPDTLLEAQRKDRLVIFAGAGVSLDSPSDLPLFDALARRVGEKSSHPFTDQDLVNPDRFLGDLSERTDVHQLAADIIGVEGSSPNDLHRAILHLAVAGGSSLRVVTTNYDLHFSTAARTELIDAPNFDAPALPMGDDFLGIVHLHGSLRQTARHLVLTDKDFGRAYLTDAWAAQFLHRMFREYTVLFVGYSHADMVMDYLARGLPRGTSRYALTPENDLSRWRRLEITPVPYPLTPDGEHTALGAVLVEWASRVDMGLLGHRQRIADLVSAPPPEDPVSADYLAEVLTSEHTAIFFAEFARGEPWLAWAESQDSFKAMTTEAQSSLGAVLARWFVSNFVMVESETQRALKSLQMRGGEIGRMLWYEIALGLYRASDPGPSTFQTWVTLLIETAPVNPSDLLDFLLNKCQLPDDRAAALLLLDYLVAPQLKLAPTFPIFGNDQEPQARQVRPEVTARGDQYWLPHAWDEVLKPHLDEIATEVAAMTTVSLSRAHQKLVASSAASRDWDPLSFARSAIEPHEQDEYKDSMGAVVDIARDSIEHLVGHDLDVASGIVESWAKAEAPLLRRLAVHAWSHRADKTADEKLSWLLSDGRLFDHAPKHEIFRLIQLILVDASAELRDKLVDTIVNELPQTEHHDYAVYNYLVWITSVDPQLAKSTETLKRVQEEHPDFGPREHPDLDHWMSSGSVVSTFPLTAEELHDRVTSDAQTALKDIVDLSQAGQQAWSGWQDALQSVSTVAARWPADGHKLLAHTDDLESEGEAAGLWRAVLDGWATATLDPEQWKSVLDAMEHRPTDAEVTAATTRLLERGARRTEFGLPQDLIPEARLLARSLWVTATGSDIDPTSNHTWYGSAINSPAGAIAEFWVHSISSEWRRAGDDWCGLTSETTTELNAMLADDGPRGASARAIFGGQLLFLFGADEGWCVATLLPLFNWNAPTTSTQEQVWDGYLQIGRWNERLLDKGLLSLSVDATTHIETHLPALLNRFCTHLAAISLFSEVNPVDTGWLSRFIAKATPATREGWARRVRETLAANPVDMAENRWTSWIQRYWEQRLHSTPTLLSTAEATAMAAWTPYFGRSFPDAVKLATAVPASLEPEHLLIRGLIQSGVLATQTAEAITLLTHLLTNTPSGGEPDYQLEECVRTLRQNSDVASLRPLVDAAIRAGYQTAASWIENS